MVLVFINFHNQFLCIRYVYISEQLGHFVTYITLIVSEKIQLYIS